MRWCWVGLIIVLLFDVWLRGYTFAPTVRERLGIDLWPKTVGETEPLDCDESAYAYIGRRVVRGDVLYRDLTENKPPVGYWIYAATVAIGGANELTIRLMPLPFVLTTIGLVWWIALRLRGAITAFVASLIYAVVSTDPYVFGNGANMEHFINLFSTAALALVIAGWTRPGRAWLMGAGACLGAACLVKQVGVTHWLVFALALLLRRCPGDTGAVRAFRLRLRDVSDLTLGASVVGAAALVTLIAQGAGSAAFDDIVRYGGALVTDTPPDPHAPSRWVRWLTGNSDPRDGRLPWPFGSTDYLVWWGTGSWPAWLAAVPAVAWLAIGAGPGRRNAAEPDPNGRRAEGRLVAAWTLSACAQVVLPGLYWQHYYMLPIPGLAIALAVFLTDCVRRTRTGSRQAVIWLLCAALVLSALGWTGWIQYRDYLSVAPGELTARYKGGRQWIVLRDMGRDLARRATIWRSPHLFVWGWQSPLFIYGNMDSVSRHFFADPLLKAYADKNHPLIAPRTRRIMEDLRAHPPELIFAGDPPFPALKSFLRNRYAPSHLVRATPDGRGLWVERTSYARFENGEQGD
jgi:hypothetical protein